MKFESIDIVAAIQNVMDKRFKTLTTECGMTSKEAHARVWAEFERGIAAMMSEQARLLYLEGRKEKR